MSTFSPRLAACVALLGLAPLGMNSAALADEPAAKIPVITSLPVKLDRGVPTVSGSVVTDAVFFANEPGPSVLRTAEQAEKLYGVDGVKALQKQVDFDHQYVRIFQWSGSGGDVLSHEISDTQPPEITFTRKLGMRKDIRPHLHVYAVRKDVKVVSPVRTVSFPGFLVLAQELKPAIVEVKGVKPSPKAFKPQGFRKPIEITSGEDVGKHFGKAGAEKLAEKVDFDEQIVLVFAWRGSGQDKLEYVVAESFPEQITFTRRPGRTRDLRPHVRVFALRKNVKWSAK